MTIDGDLKEFNKLKSFTWNNIEFACDEIKIPYPSIISKYILNLENIIVNLINFEGLDYIRIAKYLEVSEDFISEFIINNQDKFNYS